MTLAEEGFTGLIPINEVVPSEVHRIQAFSSGNERLDDFLAEQASEFHSSHIGYTNVLFHSDFPGMVGYVTMANDSIKLRGVEISELGLNLADIELPSYPAVKIGRLAVHKDLKRQGIGKRIMDLALGQITGNTSIAAARILITDAVNDPNVLQFYASLKFEESIWAAEDHRKGSHGRAKERATIKMIRDIYNLD